MFRFLWTCTLCLVLTGNVMGQGLSDDNAFTFGSSTAPADLEVAAKVVPVDATAADLQVTVTLPSHHYIYGTKSPNGIPAAITVGDEFEIVGAPKPDRAPQKADDPGFGKVEKFYDSVTWTLRVHPRSGSLAPGMKISGELTGQFCSSGTNGVCRPIRPPKVFEASVPANFSPPATATETASDSAGGSTASALLVPAMRLPPGMDKPPITFTVQLVPPDPQPGDLVKLHITAQVDRPYYTYAITGKKPEFGPGPTELELTSIQGLEEIGSQFSTEPAPEEKPNEVDGGVFQIHHDTVTWTREFQMAEAQTASVAGSITFQVCNETTCLSPTVTEFHVTTAGSSSRPAPAAPLADATKANSPEEFGQTEGDAGLLAFLLAAVGAGFVALLTPCVYPMVPVTISYFLKQGEERPGETIKLAVIYCLSIVAAFTVIGLTAAVVYGPGILQVAANNRWLNLFLAAVFTIFALMLMGMFEISVPSWLLTWTSKKQESGGYLGVIFMALTFTLVSFTCTFVFVGQVLVAAAEGDYLRPILGMIAFSTAFASPFFLLALFPSLLQKMPKSGGWMNRVKVTLGLLEIAIVTKFLSVADIGFSATGTPKFLDYHLVVASWIAVAFVTGMYLLNVFRTHHDSPSESVGPVQCLFAMSFMGIGAYLLVGLFAAKPPEGVLWQTVAAFAPPQMDITSSEEGYTVEHDGLEYSLDFDAAVKVASKDNKPLFLDFTGVNCMNCRQMERVVLSQNEVHDLIEDMVRVQLYTDTVPGVSKVSDDYDRLLKRNMDLQETWLKDVAIPIYVIATPDGSEILATFKGNDQTNGELFRKFLSVGKQRWQDRKAAVAAAAEKGHSSKTGESAEHVPLTENGPLVIDIEGLDYALDYKKAAADAKANEQLMFIQFTAMSDVNSRAVEERVLGLPRVQSVIQPMKRIQVFTDTVPGQLPDADNNRLVQQNRQLQEALSVDRVTPMFVIASPDGRLLASYKGLEASDGAQFEEFLAEGLAEYEQLQTASADAMPMPVRQTSFTTDVAGPALKQTPRH